MTRRKRIDLPFVLCLHCTADKRRMKQILRRHLHRRNCYLKLPKLCNLPVIDLSYPLRSFPRFLFSVFQLGIGNIGTGNIFTLATFPIPRFFSHKRHPDHRILRVAREVGDRERHAPLFARLEVEVAAETARQDCRRIVAPYVLDRLPVFQPEELVHHSV